MSHPMPSIDAWMREAKCDPSASQCGMYLAHNGVVRSVPKAIARGLATTDEELVAVPDAVGGMEFSFDQAKVDAAIDAARSLPGIFYVRVWLNEGKLELGDDIMLALVGGDIRPHVIDALQQLVGTLKNECVTETEIPQA